MNNPELLILGLTRFIYSPKSEADGSGSFRLFVFGSGQYPENKVFDGMEKLSSG
jgi:hypothetical protein